jgi:RHS repeat-associated protein
VNLTTLNLSSNQFNDTIPYTFGKLRGLDTLLIGSARVTNPLPDTLWSLSDLRALDLSSNLLKDSIPHALGRLVNLEYLSLGRNAFKDTIPSTIAYLTKLQILDMFADSLRKPIPKGLWNIKTLRQLNLSYNPRVNDDLPSSVGKLTNLEYLYMAGDSLSGPIPDSIGYLTRLRYLDLSGNKLDSIPPSIGNLRSIDFMYLSYNRFRYIPRSIGKLTTMRYFTLNNNRIVDSIPASIGKLRSLIYFYANNNKITGSIPDSIRYATSLSILNLSNNRLEGTVPAGLWSHSYYSNTSSPSINLNNNSLSGYVDPNGITSFPPPATLHNNRFTFVDLITLRRKYAQYNHQSSLSYSPQDTVDIERVHNVKLGHSLVLETLIDRTADTPCSYQWFRSTNGGYSGTALNSESTDGYRVSFTVTEADDGALYYYTIRNQQELPGLTLYSHMQELNVVMPETRTYCLEYDQNNPTLKLFRYDVDWNEQIMKCLELAASEQEYLIDYATDKVLEEEVSTFYNTYRTNCFEKVNETLKYRYQNKEYHYTLYYYDQAGNLAQTVPPDGVRPLDPQRIEDALGGDVVYPDHKLVTKYKYSSVEELISQKTPDAGESRFWYNDKMQLRLSQNAQQVKEQNYSYEKYDDLGRVVEVGEFNTMEPTEDLLTQLDNPQFPDAATYALSDITHTYYDFAKPGFDKQFVQSNLRNRIAYITMLDKFDADTIATYYSYDVHGNVRSLLQQIPGLDLKRTDYVYDRVSGNVNYMLYQYNEQDEFIHRYQYDADNRITEVITSNDGFIWDTDAKYNYYQHGPLARVELGEYRIQGLDYFYTLQGWVKGVNGYIDPGQDGLNGSMVPKDEFSYNLGYFDGDYVGIGLGSLNDYYQMPMQHYAAMMGNNGLYNGNIAWMSTDLKKIGTVKGNRHKGTQAMIYRYDQLHRLVQSRSLTQFNGAAGFTPRTTAPGPFDEDFSYDGNGNILKLKRHDGNSVVKDDFTYSYYRNTNKLRQLVPVERDTTYVGAVTSNHKVYRNITIQGSSYVESGSDVTLKATENIHVNPDFDVHDNGNFHAYVLDEEEGMYLYDAIGNLIWDQEEGVKINWTPHGKIRELIKGDTTTVTFRYDGSGDRIEKRVIRPDTVYVTRYVRDAGGNIMAVYSHNELTEQTVYGNNRIGIYRTGRRPGHQRLGRKNYELNNHLGNVLAVVTDNIFVSADSTWSKVLNVNDYYPFGLTMEERSFNDSTYRYGYNGKEKDNDGKVGGSTYDYGFRIYNPRIGRFLSVDPLAKSYPWYTPYQFAGNKPIKFSDLDGLEEKKEGTSQETDPNGMKAGLPATPIPDAPFPFKEIWRNPGTPPATPPQTGPRLIPGPPNPVVLIILFVLMPANMGDETAMNSHIKWREEQDAFFRIGVHNEQPDKPYAIDVGGEEELKKKDDDNGQYEYFYRAMSYKEFLSTGGTLQHRLNEKGQYKGAGPFVTQESDYLTNPRAFIYDQIEKYDILVRFKVEKGTRQHLEKNSISDQVPGSTLKATRDILVIKKQEKGQVTSFGFPGQSGNAHFNPKIKGMLVVPLSRLTVK